MSKRQTEASDFEILAMHLPETPLERIRETPGFLSIFRRVGCIGDSLASGEAVCTNADGTPGYRDLFEFSWGQYLARMTGNTYYNWSKGGLRCDTFLASPMAGECFGGSRKCDAYIIGLGQNEMHANYPIGIPDDAHIRDGVQQPETYYGNYGKILAGIRQCSRRPRHSS